MPVNRYGGGSSHSTGFSSVYGMYSFPKYSSLYSSNQSLGRCGSSSPALVRSSTPSSTRSDSYSYSSIISSVMPEERNYTSRYKSRMHPYETERNEVKTIKTEDIDVETQKNGRTTATPGDIKRDTTLKLPGGKAVVRMITNRLKDCSYVTKIIPEDEENGEGKLTLGQRLALKYQMKEKPKKQKTPSPPSRTRVKDTAAATTATAAKADDSGEESEWTWETCSSSEAEDWPPPKNDTKKTTNKNVPNATASKTTSLTTSSNVSKTTLPSIKKTSVSTSTTTSTTSTRPSVAYTRSNTTSLCTTTDEGLPSSLRSSTKSNIESEKSSVLPYSSIYLRKDPPKIDIAENLPTLRKSSLTSTSSLSRPISWAGSQSYLAATPQTLRKEEEKISNLLTTTTTNRSTALSSLASNRSTTTSTFSSNRSTAVSSLNSSSSSSPSGSPALYKYRKDKTHKNINNHTNTDTNTKKPMRYTGAGSNFCDSDEEDLNFGWRKGQPPRGDVVVKLVGKNKSTSSTTSSHCNTPFPSVPPTPVPPPVKQSSPEPKSESSWEYYTESDPEPDEPAPAKVVTPAPKVEPVTKEVKTVTPTKHAVEIVPVTKPSAQHLVKDTVTIKPTHKLELKIAIPEEAKPAKVKVEDKPMTNSPASKTKANMFEDIRDIKPPEIKLFSSGKLEKVNKSQTISNAKESTIKEVTTDSKVDTKVATKVESIANDAKINNSKINDSKPAVQPKSDTKATDTVSKQVNETKSDVKKAYDNVKSPQKVETPEKLNKNDVATEKATKKDHAKTNSISEDVKNKNLVKEDIKNTNSDVNDVKKKATTAVTNSATAVGKDNKIDPVIDKEICDTKKKQVEAPIDKSNTKAKANKDNENVSSNEKSSKDEKLQEKPVEKNKKDETKKPVDQPIKQEIVPKIEEIKKEEKILSEAELRLQKLQIEEVPRNPGDEGPRRLTVEENRTIIRLYGGIMFPDDNMVTTPKNLLFEPREQYSAASSDVSSSDSPLRFSESEDEESGFLPCLATRTKQNTVSSNARPSFRKYTVNDFQFLRVLGKGSFGKVLLANLNGDSLFYAVKALRKDTVLEDDDIECILIERKVLALGVEHPFICYLFCTFQTDSHIFYAMEYLNGGDLMFHIQQEGRFNVDRARFYAAEIACALRFLHKNGIVYRDLKLDNLLLDAEGHIRIVDFGMCKLDIYLDRAADTFCGTPDYMAPEIIRGLKYTYSVDWWSFGILLYEMLVGQSPFNGCDEEELFWSICNEQPYFPRFLPREPLHLLSCLLEKNAMNRLGLELFQHPFFKPIDFDLLERKEIQPPFIPKLNHPLDVSYFDTIFTDEPIKLTPVHTSFLNHVDQTQFKGFSYTNKLYCD